MEMKRSKKTLSYILCMVLIVAMALFTNGCNDNTGKQTEETVTEQNGQTENNVAERQDEASGESLQILGEGETKFLFTVVDANGKETQFEIHTNKTIVGEALQELGMIEGEESTYGLFVKTVNNITLDYNKDGKYWAFYVNGQYAVSGVDTTEIKEGEIYSFKAEKA